MRYGIRLAAAAVAPSGARAAGKDLVIGFQGDATSLNPAIATDGQSHIAEWPLVDSLVELVRERLEAGRSTPASAYVGARNATPETVVRRVGAEPRLQVLAAASSFWKTRIWKKRIRRARG